MKSVSTSSSCSCETGGGGRAASGSSPNLITLFVFLLFDTVFKRFIWMDVDDTADVLLTFDGEATADGDFLESGGTELRAKLGEAGPGVGEFAPEDGCVRTPWNSESEDFCVLAAFCMSFSDRRRRRYHTSNTMRRMRTTTSNTTNRTMTHGVEKLVLTLVSPEFP